MATEQTITISGTPTVVSGVTVPYVNTSDLEIYIGKGKVESIEVTNAGAGYTPTSFTGSPGVGNTANSIPLAFSGGGGLNPLVRATVTGGQIDNKFWTDVNGTEFTGSGGSNFTTAPNISISNIPGGTGGQLTAKIFVKKAETTDYSISGKSGFATITFTSALANGDKVLIKRVTNVTSAANVFTAGSAITAEDLNKSFDQIRYKAEELPNVTSTALTDGDKGEINVSGSTWTIDNNAITTAKIADDAVTSAKLDTNIDIAGTLDVTGATTFNDTTRVKGSNKKLRLQRADGTTTFEASSDFGNLDIGTSSKFTASGETGNVTIAGTLGVTGVTTLTGALDANGGASIDNIQIGVTGDNEIDTSSGNLTIDSAGGTTNIDDTFQVATDKLVVNSSNGNTDVLGDLKVNTNKVTMAAATGNTAIAGSLTATGPLILGPGISSPLTVSDAADETITVTGSYHAVVSHDGAASDLDTINSNPTAVAGQFLILEANGITYDITLKETGNIRLTGSTAAIGGNAAHKDTITLIYDGAKWCEVSRIVDN